MKNSQFNLSTSSTGINKFNSNNFSHNIKKIKEQLVIEWILEIYEKYFLPIFHLIPNMI